LCCQRAWLGGTAVRRKDPMKANRITTATLSVGAAAVLALVTAGPASASPVSHPKPKPKHHHVTQVTGNVLTKALLQPGQIGSG